MVHLPAMHAACAFARLHLMPQPPQLLGSPAMLTSQPLPSCLSQSANPMLQPVTTHVMLLHATVAFCAAHPLPQPPQLATSLATVASQPSLVIMLQSPTP